MKAAFFTPAPNPAQVPTFTMVSTVAARTLALLLLPLSISSCLADPATQDGSSDNDPTQPSAENYTYESECVPDDNRSYCYEPLPPYPDFTQILGVRLVFVVLYCLVIALSIVGNSMVCLTVYRNKKMHTAVNYYIVNLAVCDLMVGAFVMPVKLLELTAPADWNMLGDVTCTILMYVQAVFVFSSVLTLVATCVERYFAIVHPLESRMHHSKSRAKRILLVVWLIPCVVSSPFLYPARAQSNELSSEYGTVIRLTCFDNFDEDFRRGYYIFLFFFIYLLSLCFIAGTCARIFRALLMGMSFHRQGSLRRQESNRRKVAKMVIVVVMAYVLFWTPYFVVTIVTQLQEENFLEHGHFLFTMLSVNFLAFTNSCVNPFIYAAMSARFRHGFRSLVRLLCCCPLCPDRLQRALRDDEEDEAGGSIHRMRLTRGGGPVSRNSAGTCCGGGNPSFSDSPPSSSQDATNASCNGSAPAASSSSTLVRLDSQRSDTLSRTRSLVRSVNRTNRRWNRGASSGRWTHRLQLNSRAATGAHLVAGNRSATTWSDAITLYATSAKRSILKLFGRKSGPLSTVEPHLAPPTAYDRPLVLARGTTFRDSDGRPLLVAPPGATFHTLPRNSYGSDRGLNIRQVALHLPPPSHFRASSPNVLCFDSGDAFSTSFTKGRSGSVGGVLEARGAVSGSVLFNDSPFPLVTPSSVIAALTLQ